LSKTVSLFAFFGFCTAYNYGDSCRSHDGSMIEDRHGIRIDFLSHIVIYLTIVIWSVHRLYMLFNNRTFVMIWSEAVEKESAAEFVSSCRKLILSKRLDGSRIQAILRDSTIVSKKRTRNA